MTDKLEGDKYITLHFVWPIYTKLFSLLTDSDDDILDDLNDISLTLKMKSLGRSYMAKNQRDFAPVFEHKVMTFLTPVMKKLNFIDFLAKSTFHSELQEYIFHNYPEDESIENTSSLQISTSGSDILGDFISLDQVENQFRQNELERYIQHPITEDVDAVKWWTENGSSYPKLFRIFLHLSCIPATSASSERDFSTAGFIINDKRSATLPENVNDLIVARNEMYVFKIENSDTNSKFVNFFLFSSNLDWGELLSYSV